MAELSLLRGQVRDLSGHRLAEGRRASQNLKASKVSGLRRLHSSCSCLALQQALSTVGTSLAGVQRGRTGELKGVVSALVQKEGLLRQTAEVCA